VRSPFPCYLFSFSTPLCKELYENKREQNRIFRVNPRILNRIASILRISHKSRRAAYRAGSVIRVHREASARASDWAT